MNERQAKLLAVIIDQFIQTAVPVGSKELLQRFPFPFSGATIRNEMRLLGDEGFLEQPHISAGRIPTAKGYRMYVKEFMQPSAHEKIVRRKFTKLKEHYMRWKDQERVYDAVMLLSRMIPNVAFATIPHKERVYYLGLANVLRQPEFQSDPLLARDVVEVVENNLADLLDEIEIDSRARYYIGEQHILPAVQSCSLLVMEYRMNHVRGVIGIMGPMRMDYAYNTVTLELVADLLCAG